MGGKIEAAKYNYSLLENHRSLSSRLFCAIVFSGHNPSPTTHRFKLRMMVEASLNYCSRERLQTMNHNAILNPWHKLRVFLRGKFFLSNKQIGRRTKIFD
ncbi:hypothetical protein DM860_008076 [Cuscuta australis]|uniref:Uncharacterized protein n=1 Tax=Cuscuta australis TaxID=267555 RepID=A0A328D383_9ASTE|nr:hypothetical protein DM860_008076 [Cuscuta australis]